MALLSKPIATDPELLKRLEACKDHGLTPIEVHEQRKSWLRGYIGLTDPGISEEELNRRVNKTVGPAPVDLTELQEAVKPFMEMLAGFRDLKYNTKARNIHVYLEDLEKLEQVVKRYE